MDDTGQRTTAADATTIETVPPPTDISTTRTAPDQWPCIPCGTANDKERTFCSYCGNRRGARTDETGMLPASAAVARSPVDEDSVARRVRAFKPPALPAVRIDPRAVVALIAIVALLVVATHLPSGNSAPTFSPQANVPLVTAPPTSRPTAATRDMLVATSGPDSPGNQLGPGDDRLVATQGQYTLVLHSGGDLTVLDGAQRVLWRAGVKGADHVDMQDIGGNLVIYDKAGQPLWTSPMTSSHGSQAYRLVMQNDGNLVVYLPDGVTSIWASWSDAGCVRGCSPCVYPKPNCKRSMGDPPVRTGETMTHQWLLSAAADRPSSAADRVR